MAKFVFLVLAWAMANMISVIAQTDFDIDLSIGMFAQNIFQTFSGNFSNGFLVSPLALYISISLISMGACGETQNEIWQALKIDVDDRQQFSDAMLGLLNTLKADESTIKYNSKMFMNETQVSDDFISLGTAGFGCEMQSVNFTDGEVTYKLVDEWITEHVKNGSINYDLTGTYFLDDLYMASIVTFNGEWSSPFDVKNTTMSPFLTLGGDEADVEMMYAEGLMAYFADFEMQYLQLNYKDTNWTMTIMLPKELDAIEAHLQKINNQHIKAIASIMRNSNLSYVKLSLPKFNASINHELSDILPQMGITTMFGPGADFSEMLADQNDVSDLRYMDKLMVNEWGTGAASDDNADTTKKSYPIYNEEEVVELTVNHTFIFYITNVNEDSSYPAFVGLISNPANATFGDNY